MTQSLNTTLKLVLFNYLLQSIILLKDYHRSDFKGEGIGKKYCIDTEPLYHAFLYSPVSLLSIIYPLPAMHSLLVTLYTLNKSVINYLPRCS